MVRAQWQQLAKEHKEWEDRNFPNPDSADSLMNALFGVWEESGELAHAHLKAKQKIRGSQEQHISDAKDAVGDMMIYLLHVMEEIGYYPSQGHTGVRPFIGVDHLLIKVGISVGQLLSTPNAPNVSRVVEYTSRYCSSMGWNFDEIVWDTWEKVRSRDWVADPISGGEMSD